MKGKILILTAIMAMSLVSNVSAAARPVDPEKQTPWDLYVDSREAYDLKMQLGDKVLFIDVRDPAEIQFTGFTDVADINIPFKMANIKKWNSKKSVLQMEKNPDFIADIEAALTNKSLTKDDAVILRKFM